MYRKKLTKERSATFLMMVFMLMIFCNINGILKAITGVGNIASPVILICSVLIYALLPIKKNFFTTPFLSLILFLVFFIILGLISTLYNLHHYQFAKANQMETIRVFLTAIIILFSTYVYSVWSIRNISSNYVISLTFFFFLFTLILGILAPYIGLSELLAEEVNLKRASGLFSNPNKNGLQANLTLILAYFLFLKKQMKLIPFVFILFLCFYGAFTSFSKTAMITICFSLLFFIGYLLWISSDTSRQVRRSIFGLCMLMVGAIGFLSINTSSILFKSLNASQLERIREASDLVLKRKFNKETTTNRSELLKNGLRKIQKQPLIGYGLDTFSAGGLVSARHGVHNTYLKIIGEAGVFVFLFFVGILFYLMYLGFSIIKEPSGLLLLAFLFVFTIYCLSSHGAFGTKYLIGLFGVVLAVMMEAKSAKSKQKINLRDNYRLTN